MSTSTFYTNTLMMFLLLLDGSETSMRESINVFKHFEYKCGLKLSLSKCEAIWIGSKIYRKYQICPYVVVRWSLDKKNS